MTNDPLTPWVSHAPQVYAALRILAESSPERLQALRMRYPQEGDRITGVYTLKGVVEPASTGLSRNATYDICLGALDEIVMRCHNVITKITQRKRSARRARLIATVVTLISESTLIGVILGSSSKVFPVSVAGLALIGSVSTSIAAYIESNVSGSGNSDARSKLAATEAQAESLRRSLRTLETRVNDPSVQRVLDDLLEQTNQLASDIAPVLILP